MPRDHFRRIHDWDDGYEQVQPDRNTSRSGAAADYYAASPQRTPPSRSPPAKTSRYADYEPQHRTPKYNASRDADSPRHSARRPPSPPPSNSNSSSRRPRKDSHLDRSPPPAYSAAPRATSPPPRRRDRDASARYPPQASYGRQRPAATTRHPSYDGSSSSRGDRRRDFDPAPPSRRRTFSPSPPPRTRRNYSPSPPPRDRYRSRDRAVPRASSPPPPQLRRSNTTGGAPKKGFAGLSPAWQQAGLAALQSGAVAAFSSGGPWTTEKGARVASAALAGAFAGRKGGDSGSKKSSSGRGATGNIGGALGGILADQFVKRGRKHL